MPSGIDLGGIYAELDVNSGKLESGLARGRQAIAATRAEMVQLDQDLANGAINQQTYNNRMNQLNATLTQLAARMQQAHAACSVAAGGLDLFNAAAKRGTGGAQNFGAALTQLAYATDDIQYGFQGVINNVAPFVQALTGSAGMAAAAQIAVVGLYQLNQHWDLLMETFGQGVPPTALDGLKALNKELKETEHRLEELGNKKRLGVVEEDEFRKLAEKAREAKANIQEQKDVESVINTKSKASRERAAGFGEAVGESGGKEALAELVTALRSKVLPEGQATQLLRDRGIDGAEATKRAKAGVVLDERDGGLKSPEKMARQLFQDAGVNGDATARDTIARTMREFFADGKSAFADAIERTSPERAAADKKAKADKKEDRENKQSYDEGVDWLAKKLQVNLEGYAKDAAIEHRRGNVPLDDSKRELAADLESRGMNADDAKAAAKRALDRADDQTTQADIDADDKRREREKAKGDRALAKAGRAEAKAGREADRDARHDRRQDRENDQEHIRGNDDLAHMLIPGLDKGVDLAVANGMLAGKSMAQVNAEVSAALQKNGQGMAKDDADSTAKRLVQDSATKIGDKVAEKAMEPRDAMSQVYSASDATRQIQSSIGTGKSDSGEQTVGHLAKLVQLQEERNKKVIEIEVD